MKHWFKYIKFIINICQILFIIGCIDVPAKITFDAPINIKSTQTNNIAAKIFEVLKEFPIKDECKADYLKWLNQQFDHGLLLKETLYAHEYSSANNYTCPDINFGSKEITNKIEVGFSSYSKIYSSHFDTKSIRDAISSYPCSEIILDKGSNKISLIELYVEIKENTLTSNTAGINLYYNPNESLKYKDPKNSIKNLLDNNTISLIGSISSIPAGFVGKIKMTPNPNSKTYTSILQKLLTFNGDLIIAINKIDRSNLVIKKVNGREHYAIPSGSVRAEVVGIFNAKVDIIKDGKCYYKYLINKAKKQDKENIRKYNESH